jgi:H+/gluconate symporter-like permease
MGLLSILVALGLLIWLAYRGSSVLLLAPAAAIRAAGLAAEPLLVRWRQTYLRSAAVFLAQFFPSFLLGALFGKVMEDSGAVSAIADVIIQAAIMMVVITQRRGEFSIRQIQNSACIFVLGDNPRLARSSPA